MTQPDPEYPAQIKAKDDAVTAAAFAALDAAKAAYLQACRQAIFVAQCNRSSFSDPHTFSRAVFNLSLVSGQYELLSSTVVTADEDMGGYGAHIFEVWGILESDGDTDREYLRFPITHTTQLVWSDSYPDTQLS
jgi:hypothetical protein